MLKIRDKTYMILSAIVILFIYLDGYFTNLGLQIGLKEGNRLTVYLFNYMEQSQAIWLSTSMAICFIITAIYIYERYSPPKYDKSIYILTLFVLFTRVAVVFFWMGYITGTVECVGIENLDILLQY